MLNGCCGSLFGRICVEVRPTSTTGLKTRHVKEVFNGNTTAFKRSWVEEIQRVEPGRYRYRECIETRDRG
jgi:hypothetical protein